MEYKDGDLPEISESQFRETLAKARPYTALILKKGPNYKKTGPDGDPATTSLVVEHGKRNMALRKAGFLPIVCPIVDGGEYAGIGVFDASPEDVERIYSQDPAVKAGVLAFEVHACRGFPGSALPDSE